MTRGTRQRFCRRGLLRSVLGAGIVLLAVPMAAADPDPNMTGSGSGRPSEARDRVASPPDVGQPSPCSRAGRHVTALRDPDRNQKVSRAGQPRAQRLRSRLCDPDGTRKPFEGTTVEGLFDS